MPAPLAQPATKVDIRLFDDDIAFLNGLAQRRNTTLNAIVRETMAAYVTRAKERLGLEDAQRRAAAKASVPPPRPIDAPAVLHPPTAAERYTALINSDPELAKNYKPWDALDPEAQRQWEAANPV